MSGRTADLVAASWKGILYVRKWVIPANPQTDAQTLVRESFARCITLWRSLNTEIKAWLDDYGVDYAMSGYNIFVSKNRVLEQASSLLKVVPDNPHVPAPEDFKVTREGSLNLKFEWSDPELDGYTKLGMCVREVAKNAFVWLTLEVPVENENRVIGPVDVPGHAQGYVWLYNPTTGEMGTVASVVETA